MVMRCERSVTFGFLVLVMAAVGAAALDLPHPVPDVLAGFTVAPLAPALAATSIAFGPIADDGPDLYYTSFGGLVVQLDLTWTPAGPVVTGQSVVLTGLSGPLGIWFIGDQGFVADTENGEESGRVDGRVSTFDLDDPQGTLRAVVSGLPNGRHNTNHLRFHDDRLYIANGNPNDNGVDGGAEDVFPFSGAVLSVDPLEVLASPAILHWEDENGARIDEPDIAGHAVNADFAEKVSVLASGFRNVYGIAFGPDGRGYTAMNGADDPASQDTLVAIEPGTDYGFPFCYDEGPSGGVGAQVSKVTNPTFPGYDCAPHPTASALLGWHTCTTGLDVAPEGSLAGLYVGQCGPFFAGDTVAQYLADPDAATRAYNDVGHKVVRVVLDANGQPSGIDDFLTGLALPTDVLFGPDGAMYVADAEMIYRVAPVVP